MMLCRPNGGSSHLRFLDWRADGTGGGILFCPSMDYRLRGGCCAEGILSCDPWFCLRSVLRDEWLRRFI